MIFILYHICYYFYINLVKIDIIGLLKKQKLYSFVDRVSIINAVIVESSNVIPKS